MRLSAHLVVDRRFCLLVHKNPLNWLSVINDVCVCLCIGLTLSILLTDVFCVWTSKEWWSDARWLLSFGGRSSSAIIDAIYSHNIHNKFGGLNIALHTIIECVEHDNPMEMRSENKKKRNVCICLNKEAEREQSEHTVIVDGRHFRLLCLCCYCIHPLLHNVLTIPHGDAGGTSSMAPENFNSFFPNVTVCIYTQHKAPPHPDNLCAGFAVRIWLRFGFLYMLFSYRGKKIYCPPNTIGFKFHWIVCEFILITIYLHYILYVPKLNLQRILQFAFILFGYKFIVLLTEGRRMMLLCMQYVQFLTRKHIWECVFWWWHIWKRLQYVIHLTQQFYKYIQPYVETKEPRFNPYKGTPYSCNDISIYHSELCAGDTNTLTEIPLIDLSFVCLWVRLCHSSEFILNMQ